MVDCGSINNSSNNNYNSGGKFQIGNAKSAFDISDWSNLEKDGTQGLKWRFIDTVNSVADPGFWIRGVKFKKFRPKSPIFCNITGGLHFTWNAWNQYENRNLWK